jgi:Trypsin-like peptidase domain
MVVVREKPPATMHELLQECTLRITDTSGVLLGTGFFVAPGRVVTCAHVVKSVPLDDVVRLSWHQMTLNGKLVERHPDPYTEGSFPDVALITFAETISHPCVLLDGDDRFEARHPLYAWGYTAKNSYGDSIIPEAEGEGRRGESPASHLIKFRDAQTLPGMSGSPLLDDTTNYVCGMIKFTKDEKSDLGGYAIRSTAILEAIPGLRDAQDRYHRKHKEWGRLATGVNGRPASTLRREIEEYIDESDVRPGLSSSKLGSIHIHIDGGQSPEFVESTLRKLGCRKESEIVTIVEHDEGPQRKINTDLYAAHTPGERSAEGEEDLDFFSTTVLYDGPGLPDNGERARIEGITHRLLAEVLACERNGVVVEAERVVGRLDADADAVEWASERSSKGFFSGGFLFRKAAADGWYEVHISIDLERTAFAEQPLSTKQLAVACARSHIPVGGWFLFDHPDKWAFRSNMFLREVSDQTVLRYRAELVEYLASLGGDYAKARVRVLIEESLGVWKTPLARANALMKTVPEMAHWEGQAPREFWVVAGNFLGDQDERVCQAMQSNLIGSTRYVYFLSSFADYQRWLEFREALSAEMQMDLNPQMSAYRIEVEWFDERERLDCFIAWHNDQQREGYELIRERLTGEVKYGKPMAPAAVNDIVNILAPATSDRRGAGRLVSFVDPPPKTKFVGSVALMQTSLFEDSERYQKHKEKYAGAFDRFDSSLAAEISKLGGRVVYSTEGGYLIVYECGEADRGYLDESRVVDNALKGTRTMMRLIQAELVEIGYPEAKIAKAVIDFGSIERSIRSGGFHHAGEPVDHARLLVRAIPFGQLCVSEAAWTKAGPSTRAAGESAVKMSEERDLPAARILPWE